MIHAVHSFCNVARNICGSRRNRRRHFILKQQPNIARWDYHRVHLVQLSTLMSIDDDPIFKKYYNYWTEYTKGKVAKHNWNIVIWIRFIFLFLLTIVLHIVFQHISALFSILLIELTLTGETAASACMFAIAFLWIMHLMQKTEGNWH